MANFNLANTESKIVCPVCASQSSKEFLTLSNYTYLKCNNCALVFLTEGSLSQEDNVYTLEYIQKRGHDLQGSEIVVSKEATAKHYFSLVEKYVKKGSLLEIGCSTGIMLKVAQERGWDVYGVEINVSAAKMAAETLGADRIETKELTDEVFLGRTFSLIVLFDVIEHIAEPVAFMNILRKKLAPDGLIFLVTPDINSLSAKILRNKWPHLMSEHTRLFSRLSMSSLLEKTHFKGIKSGWALKFVNIEMLRRHLECHPHVFFSRQLLFFFNSIRAFNDIVFPFNVGELYFIAAKQ